MRALSPLRSRTGRTDARRLPCSCAASLLAAVVLVGFDVGSAAAQVVTANPILFVTQNPTANFGSGTTVFGNHQTSMSADRKSVV